MVKEPLSTKKILLIFFVVLMIFAFFIDKNVYLGTNPKTGKFTVLLEQKHETMADIVNLDIQPDRYVYDNKIQNPEQFTWGSRKIYDFFENLFGSVGPTNWFGERSTITNFRLWRTMFFLNIFFIVMALYLRKQLSFIPSKIQLVVEFIYSFIGNIVEESLGSSKKHFTPHFVTLFIFILVSNWCSLLPIPGISEPTKNLNVPLGLGIMSIMLVQIMAVKKKGIFGHFKSFCEPIFLLLPLNLVGELSKLISISFRLFGNIFGGAIIAIVIASLTKYVIVPVGLTMFFTLFAGTIQAFVFTMLSLTYLSLEVTD